MGDAIGGLCFWGACIPGSIKACRSAALKCDEAKFAQYKLVVGDRLSEDVTKHMQNCLEKIKILEHWELYV